MKSYLIEITRRKAEIEGRDMKRVVIKMYVMQKGSIFKQKEPKKIMGRFDQMKS